MIATECFCCYGLCHSELVFKFYTLHGCSALIFDHYVTHYYTWDSLALDGLGDDGEWLVAGLTQHLTQFLHTVAVHDDCMPAGKTQEMKFQMQSSRQVDMNFDLPG